MYPSFKRILFQTASCEKVKLSHRNRVNQSKQFIIQQREARFNWRLLWEFLEPDFVLLFIAAATAFAVALVNIKIPILLGGLVNSITDILKDNNVDIFTQLYPPCKKLVSYYLLQSFLTLVYITTLSSFGERLASRMRTTLFKSLMEQDVGFYDGHKTGELINRFVIGWWNLGKCWIKLR